MTLRDTALKLIQKEWKRLTPVQKTAQGSDVGEPGQLISLGIPFCKPKLIIQQEGRRETLERGRKHSLEFVLRNQTKYPLYPKEILGDDYLRTLFGPGEGTKLSYNILTLSYEYQFIPLSISAVLV